MRRSRIQSLGVWANEVDIIAAASLLNATIHVYARCGDSYKGINTQQMKQKAVCTKMNTYIPQSTF